MTHVTGDDEIIQTLNDSEDEDLLNDLDEIDSSNSSSDDSDTDSDSDASEPSQKRQRMDDKNWESDNFSPMIFDFTPKKSGVKKRIEISDKNVELSYFSLFMTNNIVHMISSQTNIYAEEILTEVTGPSNLKKKWKETTFDEIYLFMATNMLMSLVGKTSMKKFWSTNEMIATPFFRLLFSQDRFFMILKALHFSDDVSNSDKFHKIRNLLDPLKASFKQKFYPFQNICVDECLWLRKKNLSFKVNIPSKNCRSIIKLFVCCDVKTGYVLDIIIHTVGNPTVEIDSNVGIPGSIIKTMLQDYLGKGHRLYVNDYFTSPALFEYLFDNQTNACGTVRPSRKGLPSFEDCQELQTGEMNFLHTENLLYIKWCKKKEIYMISSMHESFMAATENFDRKTGKNKMKPEAMVDFNKNMRTVKNLDRLSSFFDYSHRPIKWYKKIFFVLLDICTVNAYNLFCLQTGKKISFEKFRENLISQIVKKYHISRPSMSSGRRVNNCPTRLSGRHFLSVLPGINAQGRNMRRNCRVCSSSSLKPKVLKRSKYICKDCEVTLCAYPCFEDYHTKKNY